ncbi:hypothetical protein ACHBTE_17970 [Streptomyces sp. M41]|uniref:hypothetical protein n=1 Tax=Streptomyces sp. M41 TaxID=3059412 RepID=UPI00374D11AD
MVHGRLSLGRRGAGVQRGLARLHGRLRRGRRWAESLGLLCLRLRLRLCLRLWMLRRGGLGVGVAGDLWWLRRLRWRLERRLTHRYPKE